ncbi:MAG: aminotransferase class I/II-fold pyridoxal phosphate-dependent enzyme, partial [Prevotellaceae bacterium]|nr:aminotransferase class I/II-fold pyridoxal phosphate-dependent enzyme [Prevotellaceae bacterium]
LLLIHSFTKQFGIPGLRLGYVTGPETIVSRLKGQRMPWAVNQLAQDAGLYLLDHREDYRLPVRMLTEERRRVAGELQRIEGFSVYPSDCHILLCRLTEGRASELKDWLAKRHGILIRDASNFEGLGQGHFRIAVQNPDENDLLLNALRQWKAR